MNSNLVRAAVCCLALGAALSLPQHRFAMPVQFSFRTVHTPSIFSQSPSRFVAPVAQVPSHVPVMVPVAQDFKGDSVVVTPQDLPKLGLANTKVQRPSGVEELVTADVPVEEAVVEEASAAGPLSAADESFVLTAEPKLVEATETVVEPVNTIAEPEVVAVEPVVQTEEAAPEPVMTVVEPVEIAQEPVQVLPDPVQTVVESVQTAAQPAPVSPFETETFRAYNDFINTWLRLASVNLNRPDILSLVNPPTQQPRQQVPVAAPQPREEIPVETPVEVITEDTIVVEPTTETLLVDEASVLPVEAELVTEGSIVPESVTVVSEPEPVVQEVEPVVQEVAPAVQEPEPVVQEPTPVVQEPVPVIQKSFSRPVPQSINEIQPSLFSAVPRITSRGRHSGFRYSFSHVPQRGTFFFNSIAG